MVSVKIYIRKKENACSSIVQKALKNIPVEPIRIDELTGKKVCSFCVPDDLPRLMGG